MGKLSPAEQCVVQMAAYAAVFSDSVTPQQVLRYQSADRIFSLPELEAAVESLQRKKLLKPKRKISPSAERYHKWQSVGRAIQFLRRFPSIDSVWVTGSLAINNMRAEDDVDLMIITRQDSLWITRALVALADLFARRIRRRGDHDLQLRDKWCCNLWLEEGSLALDPSQQSLYSAREVVQAIPVFQRGKRAQNFLLSNAWVQAYLPVAYAASLLRSQKMNTERKVFWPSVAWVNTFLFWLQSWRMRQYRQHETVELHRAFFHPGERGTEVRTKYEKILELVDANIPNTP